MELIGYIPINLKNSINKNNAFIKNKKVIRELITIYTLYIFTPIDLA